MRLNRHGARSPLAEDKLSLLRRRVRKLARRGDYRKAARMMRDVIALESEASAWVRLGHLLSHSRREQQAVDALKQGLYLHRRAGAELRARTVAQMILRLDPSEPCALRQLACQGDLAAA
jgi:predicted TPR repeat methyltransferase